MKKKYLLILLSFIALTINAHSQTVVIRGNVTTDEGDNLIGVAVTEKGTDNGVITDINGNFIITCKKRSKECILVFSYLGYVTKEIKLDNNQITVNVKLQEGLQELEEVIVIGYGSAKRKDLTGSIASIKVKNHESEAHESLQSLMRANIPGLQVSLGKSTAKESGTISIRGNNTLSAASHLLIVVDGMIYQGRLSDINPTDVASIDILKDASAAAIYGSKAANGVLMITTKKGESQYPTINFSMNIGLRTKAKVPKLLDGEGYLTYRKDYSIGKSSDSFLDKYPLYYNDPRLLSYESQLEWINYQNSNPITTITDDILLETWAKRLELTPPEIENLLSGKETHWDDKVLQKGLSQNYAISISQKTKTHSYYLSFNYVDNKGVIVGDKYRSMNTRVNLDSNIKSFLTIGINSVFSYRDEGGTPVAWSNMSRLSPYAEDLSAQKDSPYNRYPTGITDIINPLYDIQFIDKKYDFNSLTAKLYAILKLPLGIEYEASFSPRYEWSNEYIHKSSENIAWNKTGGYASRNDRKIFGWIMDHKLQWEKSINEKHRLNIVLAANAEKHQSWKSFSENSDFTPNDILGYHNLANGKKPKINNDDIYSTGDAIMARLFYGFDNRYLINVTGRRDGYSAFGLSHPRGNFASVGLGWVFSNESFLKESSKWLDFGKIRLSWGENGNRGISEYAALSDIALGNNQYIDNNGNAYTTARLYMYKMANSDLKWERVKSINVGLDFSLFNNKISANIDYYNSNTHDLLVYRTLPKITGYSSVMANLGQLRNNGLEIAIDGIIIDTPRLLWQSHATFSMNRRKIIHLYGDKEDVKDQYGNIIGQKESDDITSKWFIGQDPDRIWDYKQNGVWQESEREEAKKYGNVPGDYKYIDQNNDGVLTNEDKVFQGYTTPRFRISLRNDFIIYKNFEVSFNIYSCIGHYRDFEYGDNNWKSGGIGSSYDLPRWTKETPINDFARIGSKNLGKNYVNQSFVRLDNLTASYNLCKKACNKIGIKSLRVSLTCNNLAVFAPHWKYFDPENGILSTRGYTLGLNFSL